jgi:thioredoxin-dependent peroxiredoxin
MPNLPLLRVGDPAPCFSFTEADGTTRSTDELSGRAYVVYFYPKDDTPGCTKEACGFRDRHEDFQRADVPVIGVSPDNEPSHRKFREKFSLPFALASDADHTRAKAYEAWGPKSFMGRETEGVHRVTFIIDPRGLVARVYPKVKPEQHANEIVQDLSSLHEHP